MSIYIFSFAYERIVTWTKKWCCGLLIFSYLCTLKLIQIWNWMHLQQFLLLTEDRKKDQKKKEEEKEKWKEERKTTEQGEGGALLAISTHCGRDCLTHCRFLLLLDIPRLRWTGRPEKEEEKREEKKKEDNKKTNKKEEQEQDNGT